jgi:hypothetical protein
MSRLGLFQVRLLSRNLSEDAYGKTRKTSIRPVTNTAEIEIGKSTALPLNNPIRFYSNIFSPKVKIKLSLCLINQAPRHENICGIGGIAPSFLTSALDGDEWSASCLGR